ncbi:MAG: tetratricopeptide repeat protein [Magnetococcales bacterium]|nr:tetratricopeptide repeat protein [Magnetococcales bacterium]
MKFLEFLKRSPSKSLLEQAKKLEKGEKLEQALSLYVQALGAIDKEENKQERLRAYKASISIAMEIGKFSLAKEITSNAIKEGFPASILSRSSVNKKKSTGTAQEKNKKANSWFETGTKYFKDGSYEEALEAYNVAIRLEPKHISAHNDRGIALLELERPEEALEAFNKALRLDHKFVNSHACKGITLKNLGRYEEALEAFGVALRFDPKYVVAQNGIGNTLFELQRYEEALEVFEKAREVSDDPTIKSGLSINIGNTLCELERYEEALDEYSEIIRIDPTLVDAYDKKGNIFYKIKRYEEALDEYSAALRLDQKYAHAYYGKGQVLYELERYEEALEIFNKFPAACDDPILKKIVCNCIGDTLFELEHYEEALDEYSEIIRIDPTFIDARLGKGKAFCKVGRYKEASEEFDAVLQLDPKHVHAYYSKGYNFHRWGYHKLALNAHNSAIQLDKKYVHAYCGKGTVLDALGRYKDAIAAYNTAIQLDQKYASAYTGRGEIFWKTGSKELAILNLRKGWQLDPGGWSVSMAYLSRLVKYLGEISPAITDTITPSFDILFDLGYLDHFTSPLDEYIYDERHGGLGSLGLKLSIENGESELVCEFAGNVEGLPFDIVLSSGERVSQQSFKKVGKQGRWTFRTNLRSCEKIVLGKTVIRYLPAMTDGLLDRLRLDADSCWETGEWEESGLLYAALTKARSDLVQTSRKQADQEAWLEHPLFTEVGTRAAMSFLKVWEEKRDSTFLAKAVVAIETFQAVKMRLKLGLLEMIDLNLLEKLSPTLKDKYTTASDEYASAPKTRQFDIDDIDLEGKGLPANFEAHIKLVSVINEIDRHYPKCVLKDANDLGAEILPEDLTKIAREVNHPIAYLVAGEIGGFVIFINGDNFDAITLPNLGQDVVYQKVQDLIEKYRSTKKLKEHLPGLCEWLWGSAMGQIIAWLDECQKDRQVKDREIVLVTTGMLGFFPWNAAKESGSVGQYAIERGVINFVPTIFSCQVCPAKKNTEKPQGILAISVEKNTDRHTKNVAMHFGSKPQLSINKATKLSVLDDLRANARTAIHFACHGQTDLISPRKSGLLLGNGTMLEVEDILSNTDLLTGTELISICACEVGQRSSFVLTDEFISLPASLLQMGAKQVVAPLWRVNSGPSGALMEKLYQGWKQNSYTPSQALRKAQIEMIGGGGYAVSGSQLAPTLNSKSKKTNSASKPGVVEDYSHPYAWAGFQMYGV